MTASTDTPVSQPTLPAEGFESLPVTKRLIGVSGSFELSTEFDIDSEFHDWLERKAYKEIVAIVRWANSDGEPQMASLTFFVDGAHNKYHADAEGDAGRIRKVTLKAAELGLGDAP